jgi:hypothetical protein
LVKDDALLYACGDLVYSMLFCESHRSRRRAALEPPGLALGQDAPN